MKFHIPLVLSILTTLLPGTALAAGMTMHAFMADTGRQELPDGVLKQILTAHRPSLIAGALFPDGGYGSGAAFPEDRDMAEHAHWGQFQIAFIQYLRERGCGTQAARLINLPAPAPVLGGTISNPVGTFNIAGLTDECGQLIAFAFGDAAHGITDETWDAQFEPEVRDHGEDPNIAQFMDAGEFWGPIAPGSPLRTIFGDNYKYLSEIWGQTPMNGIEYAMDVIAIVEHNLQLNSPALVFPPAEHLMAVYARSSFHDRNNQTTVKREQIERANLFSRGAVQIQASSAHADYQRVRAHMPWASGNYYLSAGGTISSGHSVAGMYQQMWQMLTAAPQIPMAQSVVGHYPAHGQTGVRLRQGGDWTQYRLLHMFFGSEVDPKSVEQPGAFCLFDESGKRVTVTVIGGHGWSRDWSHSSRVRLDEPLKKNHRYTAVLTTKVKDWDGKPLPRSYSWEFVTATD